LERDILTEFRETIGAIGTMVADAGSKTGRLKLTYGHASYTSRPGRAHVDRGATFCYEGELEGTDACTVAFDRNQLDLTPYINVAQMPDRHLSLLEGEPTKTMVGPFEASDANVHTIRTRTAMFVPFELVSYLLGKDLTAREAFLLVYPILEDNDLLEVCRPFVEFLQVSSTQPTTINPRPLTLQDRLGKADYPVRPAVINQRRTGVLYQLLPALGPTHLPRMPDTFAETLADGLTNIAMEMHADRRARETRVSDSTRPKTFRERYGDRIADGILLLTASPDDELLPPFYQELGGKQKGESERVLLQREVDQSADTFDVLAFKVTPSQVLSLKTFDFAGLSLSEVGTGVLPLSIIPPEAMSLAASRALASNNSQAETYDLSGEPTSGALSITDTQRLLNQNDYLPTNWMEARTQIRCTLALLGALCGDLHAVPVSWRSMLRQYERVEARLQHEIDTEVGNRLGPSLFVFHLQLILRDWFVDQTRTGQCDLVPAPDFGQYLEGFECQNNLNWLPSVSNIPALFAIRATPVRPGHAPRQAAAPTASASASPAGSGARPVPAPATSDRPDLGPRIRNPGRDARFTSNTAFANNVRSRRIDDAIEMAGGMESLPKITHGGTTVGVCVSYHAKGSCFEGCLHASNHCPLTASEKTPFHEWCVLAYA
jgi:hypothetical protein